MSPYRFISAFTGLFCLVGHLHATVVIPWSSIHSGGESSGVSQLGAVFTVKGTIGQYNANTSVSSGAGFIVKGGYWGPGKAISVTNPSSGQGSQGVNFQQSFSQSGGAGQITFGVHSGKLPLGLTFTSSGVLSGRPLETGIFPLKVAAMDVQGYISVGNTYSLEITGPKLVLEYPLGTVLVEHSSVVSWGLNQSGDTQLPAGLNDIQAVAAGFAHTLALTGSGSVIAWGDNQWNQTNIPTGLSGSVQAIASGAYHNLALKKDGTVAAWGKNLYGESDVPNTLAGVVAISAGSSHSLALKNNGTVAAWGNNSHGETLVPEGLSNVRAVAAGDAFSVALRDDGSLVIWGDTASRALTQFPPGLTSSNAGVQAIAAGACAVALRADGTLLVWGRDTEGQTIIPEGLNGSVKAVAAGLSGNILAVKTDGTLVAWGNGTFGQNNIPSGPAHWLAIACGTSHSVAIQAVSPGVDFGLQLLGAASPGKSFAIRNTGSAPLDLSAFSFSGPSSGEFMSSTPSLTSIPADGSSATFSVSLIPAASGMRSAMLHIPSNAGPLYPFDLAFSGTGVTAIENWRQLHFSNIANIGDGQDNADPNRNGIPNLLEYALGGDPTGVDTVSTILPQSSLQNTNRLKLSFTRYLDRTDLILTVQAADNPRGPWTDLSQSVNGGAFTLMNPSAELVETGSDGTRQVTVTDLYEVTNPLHKARFMRLKVTSP